MGLERGALINEMSDFIEDTLESLSPVPCEDTARGPSRNQKVGLHQTPNLDLGLSSLWNREKPTSAVFKPRG